MIFYYKSKKLFTNNNDIFLIDNNKITIIDYDENMLFIPKYVILYNNLELIKSEKEELYSYSKEEYIKLRGCKENNYKIQTLMKENNKIGSLLILNDISKSDISKSIEVNNGQPNKMNRSQSQPYSIFIVSVVLFL